MAHSSIRNNTSSDTSTKGHSTSSNNRRMWHNKICQLELETVAILMKTHESTTEVSHTFESKRFGHIRKMYQDPMQFFQGASSPSRCPQMWQ